MKVGEGLRDRHHGVIAVNCGVMAMGRRKSEQGLMWVATVKLPKSPGHLFYTRLNALLEAEDFDRFVEGLCAKFYAPVMGRPSLEPGPISGTGCTFVTYTLTESGKSQLKGSYTTTGTVTIYLPTPTLNGAVTSGGAPAGVCDPEFVTSIVAFRKGTVDLNNVGTICCASDDCANPLYGPPSTTQLTNVCTSETGRYAGIQCSGETGESSESSAGPSLNYIARSIVATK